MQQFVVPQFIDVEDKIFGPITTRQFVILLFAAGIIFVAKRFADLALFAVITAVVGGLALVLAFVKINGQTFHYFLLNIGQTAKRPGLRVWSKHLTDAELNFFRNTGNEIIVVEKKERKKVERSHIRDLSLLVNTGGFYKPDDDF